MSMGFRVVITRAAEELRIKMTIDVNVLTRCTKRKNGFSVWNFSGEKTTRMGKVCVERHLSFNVLPLLPDSLNSQLSSAI